MGFVYRTLASPWFRTFIGVIVVSVIIWFLGPLLGFGLLHPLETEIARWILIALMWVLWLVTNLLREFRAYRKDKKLAEEITETPADPNDVASKEEIALLRERLRDAMKTLKTSKLDGTSRKRLASLPWYMFIGPPGAGKTTALRNCGLKFPLADSAGGADALKGVGGTRNCDWWFTDEAVLIDTAGRYTTLENQEVDHKSWLGFLKLLKTHRRRQPLNGVIVSISLTDLATQTEEERLSHAQAIRRRVRELQDELGVRIPVYVLFTKADMIAGFVETFARLRQEERDQVWGVTFPLDKGTDDKGAVGDFPAAFDALLARLNDQLLERVHEETELQRRRLIYGFPQQLASLRDIAADFLTECFKPSRLEARPLLRGVYLTSGTQDGTPIDRLLGTMAAEFGLPRQSVTAFSGRGRSFFLSRLVKEVIFGEASLVGLDPKVERRQKILSYGTYALCGTVLLACLGTWVYSFMGNRELIDRVHASAEVYNNQLTELGKRGPMDTDLAAVVPPLTTLRGTRRGYDEREADVPVSLTFGLYQGDKLGTAATDAYVRALNGLLLPRLIARLETELSAQMANPDMLYPLLKVYLILGRQGPLDRDLVMQWLSRHLIETFPGEEDTALREALTSHADAMLNQPLVQVKLDDVLIAQAREILTRQPLAEYSYNRILRSKRATALPGWSVADKGGPGAGRVFELNSHRPLDTSVAGIYTWSGYHDFFLRVLPSVTQDLSEDAWVLGRPQRDILAAAKDTNKLRRDVMALYLLDYERKWDDMLADITIKPFGGNIQLAMDELGLLGAPISPFREVLVSIDGQTQLSRAGAADAATAAAQERAGKITGKLSGFAGAELRSGAGRLQSQGLDILNEAFGNDSAGKPVDPARRVDEHFKTLHDYVTPAGEGKNSALDLTILKFQQMYQNFNTVASGPNAGATMLNQVAGGAGAGGGAGGGGGGGGGATAQIQDVARDLPRPVAAMLGSVTRGANDVARAGAGEEVASAWKSSVLPLCEAAFNRYPMVAGSAIDVPVDDFAKLLAPGGVMDQFFAKYLKPFADVSHKPWKWLSPDKIPAGLSPGSLGAFEQAAAIRDALYNNGKEVMVKFQLAPVSLDPGIAQISVDIGGDRLVGTHGPPEKKMFQWPGTGGKTLVRVTMTPASGSNEQVVERDGPWSLLRLLDTAKISPTPGQPDKFRISFTGSGGIAMFDLSASSVNNPFTLPALRSFRCPAKL